MAPPPPPLRSDVAMFSAGSKKRSMLLQAAYDGDLRSFKKLLTSLDKRSGRLREKVEAVKVEADGVLKGAGALHLAAGNGRLEICSYLVERLRVDVDAVDCGDRTPLLHALFGENVVTFKYLLDHGANQDKVNTDGFAPLHSAAGFGYCEMVELLLAKGAYIDPVTSCGTPLHIACTEGEDRTVKILLEHNADYNKMVNGMTPLYFAISAASLKCVKLLVEAGAIANGDYILNYLQDAPSNGSAECLNCFLGFGPDWQPRNDDARVDQQKIAELKSQGDEAVEKKDFLSAAEVYSMALELDPDDATLFANRSLCWLHIGKGGKPLLSLLDAYECKKRRPDWPKACYRQSKALMLLKEYKGACDALLEGLKLDPGNAEIEDELWKAVESMKLSATTKAMTNMDFC
ncbi:hypothetical protein BDA96_04G159300 [Sorghum bicolor]|uniref:Uncharacterized protein n=1 Tax=Sorghum bicolor TaxID=4558 RepID=A0A921UI65_SORBI|nr:hypothetical protein BDA96_04G159300 [Sorghum bicolor]